MSRGSEAGRAGIREPESRTLRGAAALAFAAEVMAALSTRAFRFRINMFSAG